jgi:hypothetical protein
MQNHEYTPDPKATALERWRDEEDDRDEGEPEQAASVARDPAWRLIAWLLPLAAGVSALLALGEMLTGGVDRGAGVLAALAYAVLCAALLRDALRRTRTGRWARTQVYEFGLPLALLIVALALLARGADLIASVPALFVLLPVVWGFVHAPPAERVARLLPHALPMAGQPEDVSQVDHGEVEGIVRAVLDGLPPDIAARLESGGWSVEVRDELPAGPRDETVYGCCFYGANVIAIYRLPHLWTYGHGDVLRRGVTYTVLHEIAHALGLDETGVRRLGWLGE